MVKDSPGSAFHEGCMSRHDTNTPGLLPHTPSLQACSKHTHLGPRVESADSRHVHVARHEADARLPRARHRLQPLYKVAPLVQVRLGVPAHITKPFRCALGSQASLRSGAKPAQPPPVRLSCTSTLLQAADLTATASV